MCALATQGHRNQKVVGQEVDPAKPLKLVKEIYKKAVTIAFVPLN